MVLSPGAETLEVAIDGSLFYASLLTIHGRAAARAYAYSLAGQDPGTARAVLAVVGREG